MTITSGPAAHCLVPIRNARTQPSVDSTWTGPTTRVTATGAVAAPPMPVTEHFSPHSQAFVCLGCTALHYACPRTHDSRKNRAQWPHMSMRTAPLVHFFPLYCTRYNAGHHGPRGRPPITMHFTCRCISFPGCLQCCTAWPDLISQRRTRCPAQASFASKR